MLRGKVTLHAAVTPDRVAVVAGDRRTTYRELDDLAARITGSLRRTGIGAGALVALHLPRTTELIGAMLGVLGSGAAYTIVEDDGHLAEHAARLAGIGADLVLTSAAQVEVLRGKGIPAESIGDGEPQPHEDPGGDAAAYVLYTSGSTGVPKGVVVTHDNLRHYVESLLDRLGIGAALSYAHATTFSADLGNTCIFPPLWTGGTLHIVGDEVRRDPSALLEYLRAERVDVLKLTPSFWNAVFRSAGRRERLLRYLILGGERLTLRTAHDVLTSGVTEVLVNHYGPTETTIGVAAHVLTGPGQLPAEGSVPIGKPLGDTVFRLRTSDGRLLEHGEGELFVGGPSVTAGYRDNPEATAAAFAGGFYRTGDLVRIDADGVTEFLGRTDRQVKVNGFRVELEHVEAVLRQLDDVTDAAVFHVVREHYQSLVAVVAGARGDVRARLADRLPSHMIPSRVITVTGDFPRNANGKTDLRAVRELIEPATESAPETDLVREVWRRYLGSAPSDPDADFFAAGGSSLDAIQVIADLQTAGYRISARTFLAAPTIRALTGALTVRTEPVAKVDRPRERRVFSTAQSWFFEQELADPDHWNQAILLETGEVDTAALAFAVSDVVAQHPLLRTAFRRGEHGWEAHEVGVPGDVFAETPGTSLDLERGRVFQARLTAPGQILLVCHHLCIDAVSWRILCQDLSRAYAARLRGEAPTFPYESTSFWDWAEHVASHGPRLAAEFTAWEGTPLPAREATPGSNLEGESRSLWTAFTHEETALLLSRLAATSGHSVHSAVLGAFLQALAAHGEAQQFAVDVESHGRASFDDEVDVSRVIGWCTSTYPLSVAVVPGDAAATVKAVATAMETVPDLGLGHAFRPRRPSARIVYNYLGRLQFGRDEQLPLRPSRQRLEPARGARNDRVHDLKLTGRIVDDHLVLDLSVHPGRDDPALAEVVLRDMCTLLLALCGRAEPATPRQIVVEHQSSGGLLAYAPQELRLEPPGRVADRHYRSVLLTGATGYLGAHLLRLLLRHTEAHVHCLVRGDGERLAEVYGWYFPGERPDPARVTVHSGDVGEPGFGLADPGFITAEVEAIYHLAADTRLFGSEPELLRHNVESVRSAIQLAGSGRPKDLHYVSTLAVAGVNASAEPIAFTEDSLDIGQEFQNAYERSKFLGEQLVHEFIAQGGGGFIYRAGNVSGDSRDGRFQRNGAANRLVQLLRAVVKTGRAPAQLPGGVVLSPVDLVAEGILAISQSARVTGGTFHVDGVHEVSYADIFEEISLAGLPLAPSAARDLAEVIAGHPDQQDPEVALGRMWAGRRPRNVHFGHARTSALLGELGIAFPYPGRLWLRRFVRHLVEQGYLGIPGKEKP